MKRTISVVLILIMILLSGCGSSDDFSGSLEAYEQAEKHTYTISPFHISITLPTNWQEVVDTPYDLQFTDGIGYISIFAHADIDTPEGQEPSDEYERQCDHILSEYQNPTIVEDIATEAYEDKTILTKLWSAKQNGTKNYYYYCLVDFVPENQGYVWIAFNGAPAYISTTRSAFDEILKTVTYQESSTDNVSDKTLSGNIDQIHAELTQTFEVPDSGMSISIPENWKRQNDTEWDLQLQCENDVVVMGMYAYDDGDLPEEWTPYNIYKHTCDEIFRLREHVTLVADTAIVSYDDKTILTELWSVENNGDKFYYYCCLIDFLPEGQGCAWVLFDGIPSYIVAWADTLDTILASAEYGKTSGSSSEDLAELTQTFPLPDYDMTISLPEDWTEIESDKWDLQCIYESVCFSMRAYKDTELPEGWEPYDVYEAYCSELYATRENLVYLSPVSMTSYDDKTVLTSLWSVEEEGSEFYDYCCLIDFVPEDQGFAWILIRGTPNDMFGKTYLFDEILASAAYGDATN